MSKKRKTPPTVHAYVPHGTNSEAYAITMLQNAMLKEAIMRSKSSEPLNRFMRPEDLKYFRHKDPRYVNKKVVEYLITDPSERDTDRPTGPVLNNYRRGRRVKSKKSRKKSKKKSRSRNTK